MKRPSFQFYPADWRKDPALSTCSLAARGLWIEIMCVAHESDEYGHLSINSKSMTLQQIARTVGESPMVVGKLIEELEQSGVLSRNERGSIFSRRMVKDERLRNTRAASGRLGGNPNLLKQEVNQMDKQEVNQILTPSSSSSSSKNLTSLPATAGAREPEKFVMHPGWMPSGYLPDLARQSGVAVTPPRLAEFVAHWLTEPLTARTQAEWDKALLQSAKHEQLRAASPLPEKTRRPTPDNFAEKNYGTGGLL